MGINRRPLCKDLVCLIPLCQQIVHCLNPENRFGGVVFLRAGSNKRGVGEKRYMTKWIAHPIYENASLLADDPKYQAYLRSMDAEDDEEHREYFKIKWDIALIKVSSPFTRHMNDGVNYVINTICLPDRKPEVYAHGAATFFGFGLVHHWSLVYMWRTDYILKGDLTLRGWFECAEMWYCNKWKVGSDGGKPCVVSCIIQLVLTLHHRITKLIWTLTLRAIPGDLWLNSKQMTIPEPYKLEFQLGFYLSPRMTLGLVTVKQ